MQRKNKDAVLPLPEIDCPELARFLFDAGPTMVGGMGEVPLTAQELTAWSEGAGVHLTPWEFTSLLVASSAYASEKYDAKDQMRPSPIVPEMTEERKKQVVADMERYFDSV